MLFETIMDIPVLQCREFNFSFMAVIMSPTFLSLGLLGGLGQDHCGRCRPVSLRRGSLHRQAVDRRDRQLRGGQTGQAISRQGHLQVLRIRVLQAPDRDRAKVSAKVRIEVLSALTFLLIAIIADLRMLFLASFLSLSLSTNCATWH